MLILHIKHIKLDSVLENVNPQGQGGRTAHLELRVSLSGLEVPPANLKEVILAY